MTNPQPSGNVPKRKRRDQRGSPPGNKKAANTVKMDPQQLTGVMLKLQLIWRLFWDSRVPLILKVLPLIGVAYLLWIGDILPGLPFDDAAVVWATTSMFIRMAPAKVVWEHVDALMPKPFSAATQQRQPRQPQSPVDDDNVVDAKWREV